MSRESILATRSYTSFRAKLSSYDCRLCGLCQGRNQLVVDRGSSSARILLVGEGPGAEEDRLGKAFVGRSGRLLDGMLRESGIDPERDILIANVVKCRPPENRAPTREEAEACKPYLMRQIALVQPTTIGLLGATAARHLLISHDTKAISKLVGNAVEESGLPGIRLLPLYHPAYILRNPSRRGQMVEHLRGLGEKR